MALNSTEEIIEDIRQGKMVIIMDDEDRENEGDLLMAASMVRPEDINFMAKYGRGLICLTLTRNRCEQLRLPLMVHDNSAQHSTAFTVSIEAAEGVTTGISAADRAVTIQAAVAAEATPEDIVQPGHIFPLMAQPGGVLTRAGHTEAGCDLTRLAGVEPAAVIVEILNEDGTMARRPDLEKFAQEHGLKIGTIADLIEYRVSTEKTIKRVAEADIETEFGEFHLVTFHDTIDEQLHFALVKGDVAEEGSTLVRVHMRNTFCDMLGIVGHGCHWPLRSALKRIANDGGVLVILSCKEDQQELIRSIEQYNDSAPKTKKKAQGTMELRTYGVGAQILADLGVHKMRVLSSPMIMHGLSGFGLEVEEYVGNE